MTPRILIPDGWQAALPGGRLELDAADRHHLAVVLRRRPGDAVELFDGKGRAITAVLESIDAGGGKGRRAEPLGARLVGSETVEAAPALSICVAQGISSHERMDWTIEKAVEAGVETIVALQTRRSARRSASGGAPRQPDERRAAHWARIIASACAQCGRNRLARLDAVMLTSDWLAGDVHAGRAADGNEVAADRPPDDGNEVRRFLLAPRAGVSLARALESTPVPRTVWIACGPEAGFDDADTQSFVNAGWLPVGIGPRTLRTETAALMAVAIIQSQWGDLR